MQGIGRCTGCSVAHELAQEPEGGGVEVGGGHEGVEDAAGHGHARGVGQRLVQLHVVQIHLVVVQVPHVTGEGEVEEDGDAVRAASLQLHLHLNTKLGNKSMIRS